MPTTRRYRAARQACTAAVLLISSTSLLGCAEQADAGDHRDAHAAEPVAPAQKDALVRAVRTLLQQGQIVVTPETDRTATVKVTGDDSTPPSGSDSTGPSIIDVTRDPKPDQSTAGEHEGKVSIEERAGVTVITVPGFPEITLRPDDKTGQITITGPGGIEITVPAEDILIEAPGGLVVDR